MAAIAMALLSVAVAGTTMVSFSLMRAQDEQAKSLRQSRALAWADQAIRDFVVANGRLPCPAASRNGAETCLGPTKGWLPMASLMKGTTQHDPANLDIRYMVNQGANEAGSALDVSSGQPLFVPTLENGDRIPDYPISIKSSLDVCPRLLAINGAARRWRIAPSGALLPGAPVNAGALAYGVAVAAPGAAASNSGVNAQLATLQLESPTRPRSHDYRDLVKVTTPDELYDALGCAAATASLDTIAVAHAWAGVNEANRKGTIKFLDAIVSAVELGVAADGIGLVTQEIELANALETQGWNLEKWAEAAAWPVLWPFLPVHVASSVLIAAAQIMTTVDIGVSIASVAVGSLYIVAFNEVADKLRAYQVWTRGFPMLSAHQAGMSTAIPEAPPGGLDIDLPPALPATGVPR